jgi:hypothetical protein
MSGQNLLHPSPWVLLWCVRMKNPSRHPTGKNPYHGKDKIARRVEREGSHYHMAETLRRKKMRGDEGTV